MAIRPLRFLAYGAVGALVIGFLWLDAPHVAAGSVTHEEVLAAEARADEAAQHLESERTRLEGERERLDALETRTTELGERVQNLSTRSRAAIESARERITRLYALAVVDPSAAGAEADVYGLIIRQAYFEAVTGRDREALNTLAVSGRDLEALRGDLAEAAQEQEAEVESLQREVKTLAAEADQAREEANALRARWEEQEAARRAALEAELRRQEQELAAQQATTTTTAPPGSSAPSATTTTTPATTTTTTTRPPDDYGYQPGAGVEQWRPLLTEVFARWGLHVEKCGPNGCLGPQIDNALIIMRCESSGVPFAVNPSSGTTGLFQHRPQYWNGRVDRVRSHSEFANFPSDATPYNPEHNMIVAGMLVWESRETLIGNLSYGGPWDDGPEPFGHWDGTSRYCADPPLVWP